MEHLINKEGVNRSAEKEAGGRNALNLQMAGSRWIRTSDQVPVAADAPPFGHVIERWDDGGANYVPVEKVTAPYWMPLPPLHDARAATDAVEQGTPAQLPDSSASSGGGSDGGAEFGEPRGVAANTVRGPMERCERCNGELSQTGPQGLSGEPSMECRACELRDRIADEYGWLVSLRDFVKGNGERPPSLWRVEEMLTERLKAPSYPNGLKSTGASSSQHPPESSRDSSSPKTAGVLDKGGRA